MERAVRSPRLRQVLIANLALTVLILIAFLIFVLLSRENERGSWLVGTIEDENGQPVNGEVVIRRSDGSIADRQRMDEHGAFRSLLPPGDYHVEIFSGGRRIGGRLVHLDEGMPTLLQERTYRLSDLEPRPRDQEMGAEPTSESAEPPPSWNQRAEPVRPDRSPSRPPAVPSSHGPRTEPPGPPPPPPPSPPPPPPPSPPPPPLPPLPMPPGPGETPSADTSSDQEYQDHPDYAAVQVFYGTDRKLVDRKPRRLRYLTRYYGSERGTGLSYGWCWVTIPRGAKKRHQPGVVEGPRFSVFKYDPARHIVLREVVEKSKDDFLAALQKRLDRSPGREAFVFIHGYNVGFEEAARRTAQMHYDMKFPGAPIFYSWPSRDRLLRYWADEASVEWTVDNLRQFLDLVARQSGAKTVHLIAHSMGNRAMAQAVRELALACDKQLPLFQEIVLAAPDIDVDVFMQLAQQISGTARRVTIYASSKDRAIRLSRWFHGYPRAGESGPSVAKIDQLEGIDAIDASNLDTSLIGHSYYGSSILTDLSQLFCLGKPPSERRRMTRCEGARRWLLIKDEKALRSVHCKCQPPTFGEEDYCPVTK